MAKEGEPRRSRLPTFVLRGVRLLGCSAARLLGSSATRLLGESHGCTLMNTLTAVDKRARPSSFVEHGDTNLRALGADPAAHARGRVLRRPAAAGDRRLSPERAGARRVRSSL